MNSYQETIEYLNSFTNYEKIGLEKSIGNMDLTRVKEALEAVGDPNEKYRIVHVAGTKGKGSVCAYTASILESSGLKAGLYTSPHLASPLERIKVNGQDIPEEEFVKTFNSFKDAIGDSVELRLTYFEALTVIALMYFADQGVDVAVLETGMGGRLDATNAVDAEVCCITPVSYDHMHVLGDRIEQIAAEKAGIIKKRSKCIVSPQKEKVLEIIKEKCLEQGADMVLVGEDIKWEIIRSNDKGNIFDIYTPDGQLDYCTSGLPGEFQIENCAAAVGICEAIIGDSVEEEAFRQGIGRAFIPGRLEVISRSPSIVLDGAQNADSAKKLKYSVEQIFNYDRLILLLGLSRDKDIKGVCAELYGLADEIVLTRSSSSRAADPNIIRGYLKGSSAAITKDTKEALGKALSFARENDLILATGSFYLVGEIRDMILKGDKKSV